MSRSLKRSLTLNPSNPRRDYDRRRRSGNMSGYPRRSLKYGRFQGGLPTELKYYDVLSSSNIISATPTVTLLNPLQQGTTGSTMIGKRALIKSVSLSFNIWAVPQASSNLNLAPDFCRVMIIYDNGPQGANASASDILYQTTQPTVSTMNLSNSTRFTVLMDERHYIGVANETTGSATYNQVLGPCGAMKSRYLKVNLPYEGPSASGTASGIGTGAIYILYCGVTGYSDITYESRVRYSDA